MSAQKPDVAAEVMRMATAWAVGIEHWNAPARVTNRAALEVYAKETAARITALEAQNAELLAALKVMLEVFGDEFGPHEFESIDLARAVIAKATGSAA